MAENVQCDVVIVGAGFGGIAAAIELRKHGITNVRILEKAAGAGGTWFHNTYPGAACDAPTHMYSFSYAQRRTWSRLCAPQDEILDYVHEVIRRFDLTDRIVTGTTVTACAWDDDTLRWTVTTEDGPTYDAGAVIMATGQLHQPAYPRVPGRETFAGHSFHSAEWDHEYDLRGKRVAVVGTGASAIQLVPEVAKDAGRLVVFQRSGNWLMPRANRPYPLPIRLLNRWVPGVQALRRLSWFGLGELTTAAIRHPGTVGRALSVRSHLFMRAQLRDPDVRRQAYPDYTFGCKRVLFSSRYLPALQRPNVELVTDAITAMTPNGITTADGRNHEVDCVIYGTGFRTNDFMFPMRITGAAGRDLAEDWAAGPHAHLGITVPGYPSLFLMYGPNTNTSGGSIIFYLERQAGYIRRALEAVRARGASALDVRRDVEEHSDRELQSRFAGTAWTRCDSWYQTESGRNVANWPGYMREYLELTSALDPAQYTFLTAAPAREASGASAPAAGPV